MVDRRIKAEASTSARKSTARQATASDASDAEEESPRSRKRARGDEGDAEVEEKPEVMDEDSEEEQQPDGLLRDKGGYVMGSITRIACKNFVTYNHVEFNPGPALNMLIGPNGTGKSTVACAIAIGLGFPAKVLGRSTKLSAFVKNDANNEETWIEIELKGRPGKKNLVVRRYLYKDSEKSKFTLNGDDAKHSEVSERMTELNVQVSNLCTFLPQDRVASFSMLSHSELLVETQKAAGDRHLSQWHQTLIEEQKKLRGLQTDLEAVEERLKRRETKQAESEKDVKKAEQRIRIEHELAVIAVLLHFANYNAVHSQWHEAKQDKNLATEELKELKAANLPFEESQRALQGIVAHYAETKEKTKDKARKLERDILKIGSTMQKLAEDNDKTRERFDSIKKEEQDRKATIERYTQDVAKLEARVAQKPEEPDTRPINSELTANSAEKAELASRIAAISNEAQGYEHDLRSILRQENSDKNRLGELNNVKKQREEACYRFEADTWKGVQWMRANKDRFKGPVYEPARLNVFAKTRDTELVKLIEGPITMNAFKTFLFETQEDYDLMMREVNDAKIARINGAQIKAGKTLKDHPNWMTEAQLKQLGFDCFPIDLLEGPDAVLAWLADEHNLNKIPLQTKSRPLNTQQIDSIPGLKAYYTPEGSHTIKRSQYGNKFTQAEQRALGAAKVLSGSLDANKVAELERSLAGYAANKAELKRKNDDCHAMDNDLQNRIVQLDKEREQLLKEREKLSHPLKTWQKAASALESKRHSLEREKKKPSAEKKRAELQALMQTFSAKRIKLAIEHKDFTFKLSQLQVSGIALHLRHLQADTDLRAMASSASEKDQEIRDKKEELDEISARTSALYQQAKQLMELANEADQNAEADVKAEVDQYRQEHDLDLEVLNGRHNAADAQLALTAPIQQSVLTAHENRKKEIAQLRKETEEAANKLDSAKATIKRVHDLWLPSLESLVSKISEKFKEAFDALGLLGEIRLGSKEHDYSQWGIEILVAFRDDESLKVLTSHRQSGGERALTTVMYLMALAELAQAPFALVDEINQGMDQRVERNVHNALVKTTCKANVGQYFLLTPKLLPDLEYHPSMKVLVIQAGTWLPNKLSLADVVRRKLKRKAASMAGGGGGGGKAIAAA